MFGQNDNQNQWQPQSATPASTEPDQVSDDVVAAVDAGFAAAVNPTQPASEPAAQAVPVQDDSPAPALPATGTVSNDDLLSIKQEALQQLSPLVGHLDQSPEEKFRTTMMMIQASDDHSLLQTAYDAAKQIPDEKARAQALLDVVNEINYFTQPKPEDQ